MTVIFFTKRRELCEEDDDEHARRTFKHVRRKSDKAERSVSVVKIYLHLKNGMC